VLNISEASASKDGHDDPVLVALADTARSFPQLPMAAFGELIDGCVADVRGTSYETFEDLHHYCRCVAGSIGRLSLGIFGTKADPEKASDIADSLGVALQLTNILRDIREDHTNGRVYLPAEDLVKFDVDLASPSTSQFTRLVGLATGMPPAGSCCPCSTGAARPAPALWPASTASSSSGSRRSPPRS
jgi:phytoene synthase